MEQTNRTNDGPSDRRSFLFLQGPTSGIFRQLGRALAEEGHEVLKVNLCPGDWIYWRGSDTVMYRGSREGWPDYLRRLIAERGVTDIIYFADRFPYHKAAQMVAHEMGVRTASVEFGYLRPDWMIFEEGGQSTYSHFPNDPDWIRRTGADLPPVNREVLHPISILEENTKEAVFHLSNAFFGIFTPRYRPGRYYPVMIEFPAYIPRFIRGARVAKAAHALVEELQENPRPFFLIPLQMQNDYQLRDNAPKGFQHGFVRQVMTSFRDHAAQDAELVFKVHPADNGLERWDKFVPKLARELGIEDRVHFIDGGALHLLYAQAQGVVVINSTTGLGALRHDVPTKAMGVAIFDIEGLTHQGPLDDFWVNPKKPDPELLADFVSCLAHGIHLRGTIYGSSGREAFVKNAIERLKQPTVNQHGLYAKVPPRIAKARALGIDVDWPKESEGS